MLRKEKFVVAVIILSICMLFCGCKKSGSDFVYIPGPPAKASSSFPADNATDVPVWTTLSWSAPGADSCDVYFGLTLSGVTNATTSDGEYAGSETDNDYDPGTLDCNTTFYWRVDTVNTHGVSKGDTWSFTTPSKIYVNDATGDDILNSGVTTASPFKTIQKGLDTASEGTMVEVDPGSTYTGMGNTDLDFGGTDVWLVKANYTSPTATLVSINCASTARAFHFHSGETRNAFVIGFDITNGWVSDDNGASVLCENSSSPTFLYCNFTSSMASG
jgi:hypothetical protein